MSSFGTKDDIRSTALANGFKLKEQPNGEVDLNPYVYEFAKELMHKVDMDWERMMHEQLIKHSEVVVALCSEITSKMRELQKLSEVTDD